MVPAIEAGQADGEIRAGSATAIARGLLLAVHGFVLSLHTMVDEQVSEADLLGELEQQIRGAL